MKKIVYSPHLILRLELREIPLKNYQKISRIKSGRWQKI